MSGDSGARNRQGEMRSISCGVTDTPSARSSSRDRCRRPRRVEAADDRLDRLDLAARLAEMPDQPSGDEGLADIRAGGGDEDRGHGSPP